MSKKKIKDNKPNIKIQKDNSIEQEKKVSISFEYIINNKEYNIRGIKDKNEKLNTLNSFYEKIQEITSNTLKHHFSCNHQNIGCEKIPYKSFNDNVQESFDKIPVISKDMSFIVFRFNNQDGRMVFCQNSLDKSLLYLIGFDLNFNMYKH